MTWAVPIATALSVIQFRRSRFRSNAHIGVKVGRLFHNLAPFYGLNFEQGFQSHVTGIEPALPSIKTAVLPLHYT